MMPVARENASWDRKAKLWLLIYFCMCRSADSMGWLGGWACSWLEIQASSWSQQGVPSITAVRFNRWPGYQKAGINAALPVHTAGLSCFSHGHVLQSFFSLHCLGGEISCNLILKDRWRQISTLNVLIWWSLTTTLFKNFFGIYIFQGLSMWSQA